MYKNTYGYVDYVVITHCWLPPPAFTVLPLRRTQQQVAKPNSSQHAYTPVA